MASSKIYLVIVRDSAGDIHETWAFDNETQALECEAYMRTLPYYPIGGKNGFSFTYGIHDINIDYHREVA